MAPAPGATVVSFPGLIPGPSNAAHQDRKRGQGSPASAAALDARVPSLVSAQTRHPGGCIVKYMPSSRDLTIERRYPTSRGPIMRTLLLLLLGIPIPIIILIALFVD